MMHFYNTLADESKNVGNLPNAPQKRLERRRLRL